MGEFIGLAMAEKKKQHYVPKMYLKNFSWGEARKQINIALLRSGRIVLDGDLAGQCYEDYFYGKDLVIENALVPLEGRAKAILAQIIASGAAPKRYSQDHDAFLTFTLFQYGRTKAAAEGLDEQLDKLVKATLVASESCDPDEIDGIKVRFRNAASNSMRAVAECKVLAHDLRCKILVNKTTINFITSDNPAVFYNQFGEQRVVRSNIGIASRGLQIFLPVSPRHLAVFYDEAVYKIGNRKDSFTGVSETEDVRGLNDLQWMNVLETVYFDREQDRSEITRGHSRNSARRTAERATVNVVPEPAPANGVRSTLFKTSKVEHRIQLQLACIRNLRTLTAAERNFNGRLLRDPQLCFEHDLFVKLKDQGKYKISEWNRFLEDRKKEKSAQPGRPIL